jgi:hypothetical protein
MMAINIESMKEMVAQKIQTAAYIQACETQQVDPSNPPKELYSLLQKTTQEIIEQSPRKFLVDEASKMKEPFDVKAWTECCRQVGAEGVVKKGSKMYDEVLKEYRSRKGISEPKQFSSEDKNRLKLWETAIKECGMTGIVTRLHPKYEMVKQKFSELRGEMMDKDP